VSLILTPISPDLWQVENLQAEARWLLAKWVSSAEIIVAQIDCGNPIWLQSFVGGIGSLWTSLLPEFSVLNPLGGFGSRCGPTTSRRPSHHTTQWGTKSIQKD